MRDLKPGVYGPLPTFFDYNQDVDLVSYKRHLLNLATKGISKHSQQKADLLSFINADSGPVPVCAGSLGEAVHLSYDERIRLVQFIRQTLDEAGLTSTPIVAGVGGSNTRETIGLAKAAAVAGADAGLVILPAYYAASLNADQDQIVQYYVDICEASPIPLFLYNFPTNAAGLDMSSAVISTIMKRAPNLCGVKLTCPGSVGKLIRLSALLSRDPSINEVRPNPFLILDGLIADLTPWMRSGGHGTVSGIPNFAPRATMELWRLLNLTTPTNEEVMKAAKLQAVLSEADVSAVPGGVRAMKYALNKMHGYSIAPRRPLLPLKADEGEKFMEALKEVLDLEAELERAEKGL